MPFKNPHPFYSVWRGMKRRCSNPKDPQYADYGGRGIIVCDRWKSFSAFVEDMGDRPIGYTLERKDNNGPYSPQNCTWATRSEQQRNRRNTIRVFIEGIEYVAADLADKAGLKTDTIVDRANLGLSLSEVIDPQRRIVRDAWHNGVANSLARRAASTHCKRGHEWTPDNTRITPEGWRNCRACHNAKMRKRNAAKGTR